MALTLTQQLHVLNGTDSAEPTDGFGTGQTFQDLVVQSAYNVAVDLIKNYKIVDPQTQPNAYDYIKKMMNQAYILINSGQTYRLVLSKALISVYSLNGDYATIKGADVSQWETFIESNILRVIEGLAKITQEGKTEYNNIT